MRDVNDRREAQPSAKPIAFVVAGMHRSGTSAMARTLALCGFELPRSLMAGNAFNEDGHWESEVVKSNNDALLGQMDSAWDDALALRSNRKAKISRATVETIKATVRDQFPLDRDVIIKDPRISLLFPAWREALEELGYDVHLAVLVRHPLEVAASLTRRDNFPAVKSALLWLTYFLTIERDSRNTPRVFLTYDDLLSDWRGSLRRIEQITGTRLPLWNDTAEVEVDKFLSTGRRHHHYELEALRLRSDIPSWVRETYEWALSAARANEEPSPGALNEIAGELIAAADTYAPLVAFERRKSGEYAAALKLGSENTASLYYATGGGPYSEAAAVHQRFELLASPTIIELATPVLADPLSAIRIDPNDHTGFLRLHDIRVRLPTGTTLWQWDGSADLFNNALGIRTHLTSDDKFLLELTNKDPQFELPARAIHDEPGQIIVELTVSRPEPSDLSLARDAAADAKLDHLTRQTEALSAERKRDAAELQKQIDAAIRLAGERAATSVRRELTPEISRVIDAAARATAAADGAATKLEAKFNLLSDRLLAQQEVFKQRFAAQQNALEQQARAIERQRVDAQARHSGLEREARAREERLRNELNNAAAREDLLRGALDQANWSVQRWEQEAGALRTSTSWKITAPLRALAPRS
ncbi:MAG: sulfotransferase family protein, partial [Terricaulis sp.]